MIKSFACRDTEKVFRRERSRKFANFYDAALRRLLALNAAKELRDLRTPPGNEFEALKGDRAGQHSIRVNKQFRVCFVWKEGNAESVEIVDYH